MTDAFEYRRCQRVVKEFETCGRVYRGAMGTGTFGAAFYWCQKCRTDIDHAYQEIQDALAAEYALQCERDAAE